jgi:Leucine-rich repeat (LRR) protein
VISELSQAVNPLEIDWVLKRVLAYQDLPEGIRAQISDLSPLSALPNLQKLDLSRTQVADLSPLATLTSLKKLDLFRTQAADLSPLATLTDLEDLGLSWSLVADLSPLKGLANLKRLYIRGTPAAHGDLRLLKHLDCQIVR